MKPTRILTILLALLLWFFVTPKFTHAAQPTFGPNLLVTDAVPISSGSNDGPPILDIDVAGGVYVAWIDHRSNQNEVFFSKLTQNNTGFSSNKPLTGINDSKSFPQIEEDNGKIYISWGENRVINGVSQQAIFFTKSTDGGQTFTGQILVDNNEGLPISMVAHDNELFIVYSKAGQEIWIASSTDSGNTFSKAKISDSNSLNRQRPVADFIDNNVYVFWLDERNGRHEVFFTKSTDFGNSFGQNQSVYSNPNSAIHLLGNSFGRLSTKAIKPDNIFLAFDFYLQTSSPFSTDYEVYFIKSTDGGNNFSTAKRLSDDPADSKTRQQTPSLTLLPDGSPAIAWHDFRDGDGKVMLVYSQDQGETFTPNIRINNTQTNNIFSAPTIVADQDGKIHFVRWDAALSPVGVYYTKIDPGLHFDTTPTPFLDLPWDYQSKGLSFTEASLSINSYLDHEYPLLSSGLNEPVYATGILGFDGEKPPERQYSSHDGYDYSRDAGANIGDLVLAAATGCASYSWNSAGGNMIFINHGNGYQTRYLHLQSEGLITNSSTCVQVANGHQIGKVGYTGNVIPTGEEGAHIHFMVIQDKNNDGNFEDNIPDGITDPFGWQSTEPDPWPSFNFSYGGQARTGNTSFYLWTKAIANLSDQLTSNGGFFKLEKFSLNFPQNATNQNLNLQMQAEPIAKSSNFLESIGSTVNVTAKDAFGNLINSFPNLFTITINFKTEDLTSYDPNTISIYSSQDDINWIKESTTLDPNTKTASAQLNHLTHFALMAEKLDTTAPITTASLSGNKGQPGWYRSDVQVSLNAQDNQGGLGVDYTLYKVNSADWKQYSSPVNFTDAGNYTIQFYSADKDENIENIKSVSFNIDKTNPVATINATPSTIWSPNGKMVTVLISGSASDNNGSYVIKVQDEYHQVEPTVAGFGQTIQLQASRSNDDIDGRHYKIKVLDQAGNETIKFAEVIVPHDQKSKL